MTTPIQPRDEIITPADWGLIAAALNDCRNLGDDDATDAMASVLRYEAGFAETVANVLAYHLIHSLKRKI